MISSEQTAIFREDSVFIKQISKNQDVYVETIQLITEVPVSSRVLSHAQREKQKSIISEELTSPNMASDGAEDSKAKEAMFQEKSHAPDRTALHSLAPEYTAQIEFNKVENTVTTVASANARPFPEQGVPEKVWSTIAPELLPSIHKQSSNQSEQQLKYANPTTNKHGLSSAIEPELFSAIVQKPKNLEVPNIRMPVSHIPDVASHMKLRLLTIEEDNESPVVLSPRSESPEDELLAMSFAPILEPTLENKLEAAVQPPDIETFEIPEDKPLQACSPLEDALAPLPYRMDISEATISDLREALRPLENQTESEMPAEGDSVRLPLTLLRRAESDNENDSRELLVPPTAFQPRLERLKTGEMALQKWRSPTLHTCERGSSFVCCKRAALHVASLAIELGSALVVTQSAKIVKNSSSSARCSHSVTLGVPRSMLPLAARDRCSHRLVAGPAKTQPRDPLARFGSFVHLESDQQLHRPASTSSCHVLQLTHFTPPTLECERNESVLVNREANIVSVARPFLPRGSSLVQLEHSHLLDVSAPECCSGAPTPVKLLPASLHLRPSEVPNCRSCVMRHQSHHLNVNAAIVARGEHAVKAAYFSKFLTTIDSQGIFGGGQSATFFLRPGSDLMSASCVPISTLQNEVVLPAARRQLLQREQKYQWISLMNLPNAAGEIFTRGDVSLNNRLEAHSGLSPIHEGLEHALPIVKTLHYPRAAQERGEMIMKQKLMERVRTIYKPLRLDTLSKDALTITGIWRQNGDSFLLQPVSEIAEDPHSAKQ